MTVRIATRGSHLALAQAHAVQAMLKAQAGQDSEIKIVKTRGDEIQTPLHLSSDARKGFFTKEIEEALLANVADIAVHSYKDLPTAPVPGLTIAAVPQRISPLDTIVFLNQDRAMSHFPYIGEASTVATSSLRRISQMSFRVPGIKNVDIRGNVPTRIEKLVHASRKGEFQAILLSGAGIDRLGKTGELLAKISDPMIAESIEMIPVPPEIMVPAPAQGTLALQCRENDEATRSILAQLHDSDLAQITEIERSILAGLEGGCNLPLGVYAEARSSASGTLFGAHMYLGEEFEQNRRQRSIYGYREDSDPARLSARMLEELKNVPTIFVFGKEAKMNELPEKLESIVPDSNRLRTFAALRTVAIEGEDKWDLLKSALDKKDRIVFSIFSSAAVEALRQRFGSMERFRQRLDIENRMDIRWATTGESTASEIRKLDPQADVVLSADGTSAGLLPSLRDLQSPTTALVFLVGRDGRKELMQALESSGAQTTTVELYRTESLELSFVLKELDQAKEPVYLLAGSPLSLQAMQRAGLMEQEKRPALLTLGQTTAEAARDMGVQPYAVATVPDYAAFLSDFY